LTMLAALLSLSFCVPLQVYESYELSTIVERAKGSNEVYILILYKAPTDLLLTSAAFSRVVASIPLPLDPCLGIVVDPTAPSNQLFYTNRESRSTRIPFPYHQVLTEYIESITKGVNYEVENRVRALVETLRDVPHDQIPESEQSQRRRDIEEWKDKYDQNGARKDISKAVDDIVLLKNKERAGLIKQALLIQKLIDEALPPSEGRATLPEFSAVDPTKGEYDAEIQSDLDNEEADERDGLVEGGEKPWENEKKKPEVEDAETESTEDAAEEAKKKGTIQSILDAFKQGWNRIVGHDENDQKKVEAVAKSKSETAQEEAVKKSRAETAESGKRAAEVEAGRQRVPPADDPAVAARRADHFKREDVNPKPNLPGFAPPVANAGEARAVERRASTDSKRLEIEVVPLRPPVVIGGGGPEKEPIPRINAEPVPIGGNAVREFRLENKQSEKEQPSRINAEAAPISGDAVGEFRVANKQSEKEQPSRVNAEAVPISGDGVGEFRVANKQSEKEPTSRLRGEVPHISAFTAGNYGGESARNEKEQTSRVSVGAYTAAEYGGEGRRKEGSGTSRSDSEVAEAAAPFRRHRVTGDGEAPAAPDSSSGKEVAPARPVAVVQPEVLKPVVEGESDVRSERAGGSTGGDDAAVHTRRKFRGEDDGPRRAENDAEVAPRPRIRDTTS
jgi:hypothetical protein